ncbi:MAG: tRNA preQ1(34) S-adenosylmethionine ribosyltransferase-isomerase QueA [Deltaproteobacteria bacterium]|nr:tRNA preQ1(34) S-adenosylmethionine ribosyltransferase-isomerase QueA [Deltaproteobacteria bacterium]
MNLSDLDYSFPPELIALHPPKERGTSHLMRLDRKTGEISHHRFAEFSSFFQKGDLLIVNDSKVFPARLLAAKKTGGKIEILLVREVEPHLWECLVTGKVRSDEELKFSDELSGIVLGEGENRRIRLSYEGDLLPILEKIGHVPLPPYIKRPDEPDDRKRYQTVYAEPIGSIAAPTAGLHFTPEILEALKAKGVQIAPVTLHVGPGTFLPIRSENLADHKMHREYYEIPESTALAIRKAKKDGRQVCVVGTTAVRALESSLGEAGKGSTEKFIFPPYEFKIVDRLLTNFHQPRSSLLALVSAFAGLEAVQQAYAAALAEKYRLFSYGDCLWIAS